MNLVSAVASSASLWLRSSWGCWPWSAWRSSGRSSSSTLSGCSGTRTPEPDQPMSEYRRDMLALVVATVLLMLVWLPIKALNP